MRRLNFLRKKRKERRQFLGYWNVLRRTRETKLFAISQKGKAPRFAHRRGKKMEGLCKTELICWEEGARTTAAAERAQADLPLCRRKKRSFNPKP